MTVSMRYQRHPDQEGGIAILVVLMLLVLLTISALGMSKNAFRSAIAAGTLREAHQAENVADAGLEWTVYWMGADTNNPVKRAAPASGALAIQNQMAALEAAGTYGIPGTTLTSASYPELTVSSADSTTQSYDVTLNLMGQTQPYYQGQGAGSTSTTAPTACASGMSCSTGLTVPSAFETCVTLTILVRSLSSLANSSRINSPRSLIGATRMTAPVCCARSCQGTIFA